MMQAPWRFTDPADIVDGMKIGIELQINACAGNGDRDGVVVWNNVAHSNYQRAENYGVAILDFDGATALPFDAEMPTITKQPETVVIPDAGVTVEFSVEASVTDGGILSYQWFTSATATGTFTPVAGAINATYSFTAANSAYYRVAVTNTNDAATGINKTRTINSNTVQLLLLDDIDLPEDWMEKVTMVGTAVPVYGFMLPAGDKFGDYDRIKVSMYFDPASPNFVSRLRAWGNYNYSTWTNVTQRPVMGNATPDGLLLNTAGEVTYEPGVWADYTIVLGNRSALNTAAAINATEGVILLGFGPAPPGGAAGTRIFFFKDITLENADGTKVVKALHPEHPLLWGGNGASAFVAQAPADTVTREFVDNVEPDCTCPVDPCDGSCMCFACDDCPGPIASTLNVVGETLVQTHPVVTATGTGVNKNGSVTLFNGARLNYEFPAGFRDYDFFTIEWELLNKTAGAGSATGDCEIAFRLRNTNTQYPHGVAQAEYPDLDRANKIIENVPIHLSGTSGGFSWEYNGWQWQANRMERFTVRITKITFTKGNRHTVTIDVNGGNAVDPETIQILSGVTLANNAVLGRLPTVTHPDGFTFEGWKDGAGADVTATTPITADITFIAQWSGDVSLGLSTSLGDITIGGDGDGGNHMWDLTPAMRAAIGDGQHYLMLKTKGSNNSGGFGGFGITFEMTYEGAAHSWRTVGRPIDGWLGDVSWWPIDVNNDDHIWVINMSALPNFEDLMEKGFVDTGSKIILGTNRMQIKEVEGFIVNETYLTEENLLPMPTGAKAFGNAAHGFIMVVR
jgi:hypothetical protein